MKKTTLVIANLLASCVLLHLFASSDGSKDVTLRDVLEKPRTFKDIPIRMICIFHRLETFEMPFDTKYTPDAYVSFSAWPSDSKLWIKKEHMNDHPLFFVDRSQAVAKEVISLVPYQFVEIYGTVTSTFGDLPWIEVSSIKPLDKRRFTRQSLRQLVDGLALLEDTQLNSAAAKLEQALTLGIPENAELLVLRKLGHCYYMMKDYNSAIRWYTKALELDPGNEEIENVLKKVKEDEDEARRRARMEGQAIEPQVEETVEQLQEQLDAMRCEIRNLTSTDEELVAKTDNWRSRIEKLIAENEELANALKAIAERIVEEGALRKRLADAEATLAEKEELIEYLQQRAASVGFDIDVMELAAIVEKSIGELEEANARADKLADEIKLMKTAADAKEEIESLKSEIARRDAQIEELVKAKQYAETRFKSEMAKLIEDQAALKLQLLAMERENKELAVKIAEMVQKEQEIKELQRKSGDSGAVIDALDAARKARADLEARIQELEEENDVLKRHVEKLEQEKNDLIAASPAGTDTMLREQLDEYERALAERDAELRELKDEIARVANYLKETENAFEMLKADTSKGVNELVAIFRRMEKELASKKKESEELAQMLTQLMKERQAERIKETKVEKEISHVKSNIAQLEARLADAAEEEKEEIRIQLEKERTILLELRKVGVERLRAEFERVNNELQRERRASAELRSLVESLKAQVESLKEKVNTLKNRNAAAENLTPEDNEGE